jgi:uncharacterized membrane protein
MTKQAANRTCPICNQEHPARELIPAEIVRGGLVRAIQAEHPGWGQPGDAICLADLNLYRARYVEGLISEERGELTNLEEEVVRRLEAQELISADTNREFDSHLTFGQKIADRVARFGGSWAFILSFVALLVVWVTFNSLALLRKPFDPYPFILLNLVLSMVAALQAPVIMMSQNRQEAKDRMRAEHDYRVNLKAEMEIRLLSERMDTLLTHQWQRLLEIQQIQIELMEELGPRRKKDSP